MAVTELIGRRRSEAIAAARALDVAERRVIFLNFEDGVLADQRAEAVRRVTSLLCDERPEQIFVTSRWDTTPDHVAAAEIVKAAAAEACRDAARFEYLVWYWAHWPWAARRHLEHERIGAMLRHSARRFAALMRADLVRVPVGDLLAAKWAALGEHATQMQKFQGDDGWPTLGEVWDGGFLDCAFGESELFIRS